MDSGIPPPGPWGSPYCPSCHVAGRSPPPSRPRCPGKARSAPAPPPARTSPRGPPRAAAAGAARGRPGPEPGGGRSPALTLIVPSHGPVLSPPPSEVVPRVAAPRPRTAPLRRPPPESALPPNNHRHRPNPSPRPRSGSGVGGGEQPWGPGPPRRWPGVAGFGVAARSCRRRGWRGRSAAAGEGLPGTPARSGPPPGGPPFTLPPRPCVRGVPRGGAFPGRFPATLPPPPPELHALRPRVSARVEVGRGCSGFALGPLNIWARVRECSQKHFGGGDPRIRPGY